MLDIGQSTSLVVGRERQSFRNALRERGRKSAGAQELEKGTATD